jgi:cytochrome c
MKLVRLSLSLLFVVPAIDAGMALSPSEQRGLVFARKNCSQCHSIDPVGPSPLPVAPPFRDLHKLYPVESLEEAFAEGIRTGHPSMPEFRLEPDQIKDLIAFLKSLQ